MTIILDVGSGATLPTREAAEEIVQAVVDHNKGNHRVILKPQLFRNIPPNKPLDRWVFRYLVELCDTAKLELAVSVFDLASLSFALSYDLAHVKIACRPDLYHIAGHVPRNVPVQISFDCRQTPNYPGYPDNAEIRPWGTWLACVPEYPAELKDYRMAIQEGWTAFSDHTVGTELFKHAEIIEKHFVLRRDDPDNPDSGPFALVPSELDDIT